MLRAAVGRAHRSKVSARFNPLPHLASYTAKPCWGYDAIRDTAALVAAIGGSLFGYDTGVISGAILFVRPEFGLGTTQEELVISAALVGATIGAIASGRLTDKVGRRAVLLGAAASFAFGGLASAFAANATMLIVARLLVGAAIGVASYAVPLYI